MSSLISVEDYRALIKKGKCKRPRSNRSKNEFGVKFDSDTERDFYIGLTRAGIPFEFQVTFELVGPAIHKERPGKKDPVLLFKDRGAEAVTLTVDFIASHDGIKYILDTKGDKKLAMATSKLKYDILKHQIAREGGARTTRILFISASEVATLVKAMVFAPALFWEMLSKINER